MAVLLRSPRWRSPSGEPFLRLSFGQARWLGLAGTVVVAAAGVSVGSVPKAGGTDAVAELLHLMPLRTHQLARLFCTVATFVALAVLLHCWWQLRRHLETVRPSEILKTAVLWGLPLLIAPPLFSADIYAYAGQGQLVAHDIDPYQYGPGAFEPTSKWAFHIDGLWRFSPAPYGPLWLWLSGRIVTLSHGHFVVALYLFRIVALAGLALLAVAAFQLSRGSRVALQQAWWLLLANPLVLLHGIAGAHNDFLMSGLLLAGLSLAFRSGSAGRLMLATVLVALAGLVKAPALLALPFLPLFAASWRRRAYALPACAGAGLATYWLGSHHSHLGSGWVSVLRAGNEHPSVWSPVSALVAGGGWLHDRAPAHLPDGSTLGHAAIIALALTLAYVWTRALRGADVTGEIGQALLAVFVLGVVLQPWYLIWSLGALAARGSQRVQLFLAVLSSTLVMCVMPGGRSWVRPPFYGAPVAVAILAWYVMTHRGKAPTGQHESAAE